ncbi:hypothetical protein BV96_03820 [Sphingomonas paucimobilis]|uniref:hypothetical protein n=1 Tax=Sphingobium sp. DC-2 TaxID=1303256 RepID=UPI00044649AE|nr:hypothetical protein [Sphingobium sp. DC-2]EZP69772.1 hypothetical protein BV96_03820 [Sphingomonas paucimobilis]
MPASSPALSPKRLLLCSRENANRVASRLFDERPGRISIVRTTNPIQPFRVCTLPSFGERVEVEMVL